ncbi:MAG: uracil-DNA glycosylase [Desulfatitalea sp.]|nr:uracil-DNA glycosylase [Desulfatitalea sp.]
MDETLQALRRSLDQMARWGCRGFDCSEQALAVLARWSHQSTAAASHKAPAADKGPTAETLEAVRTDLGDCTRCRLSEHRTRLVFGEGAAQADLVFVGEGPGGDEDRSGRPFVGPAGQLLTKIIESMHLTRDQVYIGNIVKCRPPGNRLPEADEIGACLPFLTRQISAIQPKVVCALGACAAQTLLDTGTPISRLRGRFHDANGLKVMPTFHPSYLLRHPEHKRAVWEDMKKIMALLRIPL